MDRRNFLRLGAGGAGAAAVGLALPACSPMTPTPTSVYSAGVASGLHSPTEVVLWTRVEPALAPGVTSVTWEVADSAGFGTVVASGSAPVSAASDHTVKVLVGGLDPDRSYWYRFSTGAADSPVGRARTMPVAGAAVGSLKLAYASCQCYANGYYGAWRDVATRDVDAVLFLGDYIYEAGLIQLLGKVRDESFETVTDLAGYRSKYKLYKSDPDLQAAHAAHPFVPIWDDHEIVNDYDRTIFTTEPARAAAAYQAWFEYQPVWPIDGTRIYRDLPWGDLGHLFMLDTRQYRDPHRGGAPLYGTRDITTFETAAGRSILGADQRSWLTGGLAAAEAAGTTWKVIGNQVLIMPLRVRDDDTPAARAADPSLPLHAGAYTTANFDTWDGYAWERDLLLRSLADGSIRNTVFLTGDYHAWWQSPLTPDFDDPAAPVVANEFAAGAISSAGGANNENVLYGDAVLAPFAPRPAYIDGLNNGYGLLEADASTLTVTYLKNDAQFAGSVPVPRVRFTLEAGDPNATQELL